MTAPRPRLLALIHDAHARLGTLDPTTPNVGKDDADLALIHESREQYFGDRARLREQILDATDALARLDAGTYGMCDRCGKRIAEKRLAAMPCAVRCVGCQGRVEQGLVMVSSS